MHDFRLTGCANDFLNRFSVRIKGGGAIRGQMLLPFAYANEFIKLCLELLFTKPSIVGVRFVFHNAIYRVPDSKANSKVI